MKKKDYKLYSNVKLGRRVVIEPFALVGKPSQLKGKGNSGLSIGGGSLIRSGSVIYAGSNIGKNFITGSGVFIREGNLIGDNVSIGTLSILEIGNKIGNNVRIHSGCFMEMAEIGDDVFVGPCVVMIDDPHPPCKRYKDCVGGVKILKGAKIGANATLLPGIKIGEYSVVGAGSVVVKDVPDGRVVVGNPAKVIKKISDLKCFKGFFKRPYESG